MTDEQLQKLPQWAQREFRSLSNDIETLKEDMEAARGLQKDEGITVELGHNPERERTFFLPRYCRIKMGGYEFGLHDDGVYVWGHDVNETMILPRSGNTFLLKTN